MMVKFKKLLFKWDKDLEMYIMEMVVEKDLGDLEREGKRNEILGNDERKRKRRNDEKEIGKRNGLLKIVGKENEGIIVMWKKVEKKVKNDEKGLRIEREEGIVNEKIFRIEDKELWKEEKIEMKKGKNVRIEIEKSEEEEIVEKLKRMLKRIGIGSEGNLKEDREILKKSIKGNKRIMMEEIKRIDVKEMKEMEDDLKSEDWRCKK